MGRVAVTNKNEDYEQQLNRWAKTYNAYERITDGEEGRDGRRERGRAQGRARGSERREGGGHCQGASEG